MVEATAHLDDEEATEELKRWSHAHYLDLGFAEADIRSYETKTFWPMQVAGIRRWLATRESDRQPREKSRTGGDSGGRADVAEVVTSDPLTVYEDGHAQLEFGGQIVHVVELDPTQPCEAGTGGRFSSRG